MQQIIPFFSRSSIRSQERGSQILLRLSALILLLLGISSQRVFAQAGKNGAVTIAATSTILNEYTTLTANAALNATTITVANSALNANGRFAAPLATGDLLLLVQPQGAIINSTDAASYGTVTAFNNAGRYQLVEVASVPSGTSIVLSCRLFSPFTTAGHTQVVRVPRYTTLSLNTGVTVTAQAWDGSTGGVVAIETTGAVTLTGSAAFNVSALGFRGGALEQNSDGAPNNDLGYRSTNANFAAEKGESIAGNSTEYDALGGRYGRGAPANGGGGGNSHNAAGGGGANAAVAGTSYTGLGNPDRGPSNAYDAAWNLEAANFATATSSGGGRGGYSYSATNQDALTLAAGQAAWGGDRRQNKGGLGGRPVASSGHAFFGGGGGAGDSNNNTGTAGAVGGGFIYLVAGGAVTGGTLTADGGSVTTVSSNDAAGGGGGGGSVVVNSAGLVSSTLQARGGAGGSQGPIGNEAEGAGGGGGGGLVMNTARAPTTDVSGGLNGTTASASLTEFLPNGGTRGAAGRAEGMACAAQLCPAAVADVATSVSFAINPLPANQTAFIKVSFMNNGPDAAANVMRQVQLPAGLGAVTVTTSTGTGTYDNGTGTVTFSVVATLASGANADATISYTPTQAGSVNVSCSISTDTYEACQLSDNRSDNNTLIVVNPADLQVTLTGPSTAAANSSITYTATVQNISPAGAGTADATSVVLTVQLPVGLLTTAFPTGTVYDFNTGVATLAIGQVNRGAAASSYAFTFTLPNNNQPVAGVASATAFEFDPNAANNNGGAASMRAATTVALPAGTGTCSGNTFDNSSAATQGLYAEYFKTYFDDNLAFFDSPKVADLKRSEGNVNYTADNAWGDITAAIAGGNATNPDQYSARYRGYLTITTAGNYTFSLLSDDAAYLWLDNAARANPLVAANTVVKDPGQHAPRTSTGTAVFMAAGSHPLLALYGENGGDNRFQISYSGSDTGGATVVIPTSALCSRQFSGPLPVQHTAFTAQAEGRAARLSWRTATELNNDHFDLERSRDGRTFNKVGEVKGAGSSSTAHEYAFIDANAAEATGGHVYYRLRQVDVNGASEFSPIRTLEFGIGAGGAGGFLLFPNPAQQRVSLQLSLASAATVRVTDLAGRIVLRQSIEANAPQPALDLSTLPTGVYVVQVEQNGQRFTQRLVHTTN